MDLKEIKETDIWTLYKQGVDYCRLIGMYGDTDRNYRMYNGDQWHGLKIAGIEKIQYNFIKPIVRYKTGIVMANLYAINYSSENYENQSFRKTAEKICELLNKKAAQIWERDYMDLKLRLVVKDAAINDEGIIYVNFNSETGTPVNEILDKNDIYYGNENSFDIQSQPYILIKQRKSVLETKMLAEKNGVAADKINYIMGDLDNIEETGESAKYEKDPMCTVVTKLYREKGKVHFAQATRYVDIKNDTDAGLTNYPIAHMIWEEKKGSARGEGEVRYLIPNQIETNKTAMRRALTVKKTAYPQKVANVDKIQNMSAVDQVGSTIKTKGGMTVDDVTKVIAHINPAQMSPDVEKLQNELIQSTRELAGAGDIATGQINPESASGRAILAIQQASQQPLSEHLDYTKKFVEDLARIWLEMITVYNDSIQLEDTVKDPITGEDVVQLVTVPQVALKELYAAVKVDITPKGAFDKYAQEQSIENLLTGGFLTVQRMPELKLYVQALDDNSVMPKQKLLKLIEEWEKEQEKIMQINTEGQAMIQRAQQFINGDPDMQAQQIAELQAQQTTKVPEDEETEVIEDNPDDN